MPDHKGKTNKKTEIKLESDINRIVWTAGTGCPGGKVGLEIETQFVGVNSEASIEITDKSGKKFDTIKKKIYGNKLWLEITVPEKAKDELYAEIKLSKHGVSKKSRGLYLFPFVEIKNPKWDKEEVRRGDILKLSADIKGLADGNIAEIQIWEHDADDAHDLVTKFPVTIRNQKIEADWEFQYVDDTDDIPTQEESEKGYQWPEYFFRVVCAGKSADSKVINFKDWIEIEWKFLNGKPAANKKFKLFLPDGNERSENFDENGKFRLEDAPPGPLRAALEEDEDGSNDDDNEEEKQKIKLVLKDADNNSYSNKKFEIQYGLDTVSGNTSGDGMIEAEIPADVQEAKLLVWLRDDDEKASYSTTIQFEQLEPENDPKGIQKRLQGLGFYNGPVDGELGPMTRNAIKNFQKKNNLPTTGIINSELSENINKKYKNI